MRGYLSLIVLCFLVSACATVTPQPRQVSHIEQQIPTEPVSQKPVSPTLKRKVAIGRFSNSTQYGKALLFENEKDPLADQASDILSRQLVNSGKFLIFERPDINLIKDEQSLQGQKDQSMVGVNSLIIGSITEFGRKTEGKSGFLSSTKKQTAYASVALRLVDVKTGLAFFSTKGTGSSSVESGEVAGFGSRARYDSTLNDRALSAAIADAIQGIIQKLEERPWKSDILNIQGQTVMMSGGPAQGIKIGDKFKVLRKGKTLKSQQTGLPITLPADYQALIEVHSFFGAGEYSQGAIAHIIEGQLTEKNLNRLVVQENK